MGSGCEGNGLLFTGTTVDGGGNLSAERAFQQRTEPCRDLCERNSGTKGLRGECAWRGPETARRPTWLEWNDQGESDSR